MSDEASVEVEDEDKEAALFRMKETEELHKAIEKERKQKQYARDKLRGRHRTVLIPFELDDMLRAEATKRQMTIADMMRFCLTSSLKMWS